MRAAFVLALLAGVSASTVAHAEEGAPPAEGAPAEGAAAPAEAAPAAPAEGAASAPAAGAAADAKPKPPPYSLPWQLRTVVPKSVVRLDTSILMTKPKGADSSGTAIVPLLFAGYAVNKELMPFARVGYVTYSPPQGDSGAGLVNPALGAIYALALSPEMRLGLTLGVALPLGMNGGDSPKPEKAAALGAGAAARRYMDNALFATNYLTVFPGVGFAYIASGLTVQAEVTLLQLQRAKGGDTVEPDKSKTNMTAGLHVGYFVIPMLSLGAELNYQRWISEPKKPNVKAQDSLKDNLSVAVGPRLHLKVGESMWIRPGIAYARFLDKPMGDSDRFDSNHIVQIDIPVAF